MPDPILCQPSAVPAALGGPLGRLTRRVMPTARLLTLALAAVALGTACSGERPYLLDGTTTTTAAAPAQVAEVDPVRSDCPAVAGPGPVQVVVEPTPTANLCVAVAAYQQIEFVNNTGEAIDVQVGPSPLVLRPAQSTLSDPIGQLLPPGYTGITSPAGPIVGLWVVDIQEDTLVGERMGLRSLGPIEIGDSLAEVADALATPLPTGQEPCFVTSIEQDPYSPLLTVQDGAVSMIEVYSPNQFTRSEVGIGTAEGDIRAVYGSRVEEQPSPDGDPNRKLLVFVPADDADQIYRLVFEVENGVVVSMRNGVSGVALTGVGCP